MFIRVSGGRKKSEKFVATEGTITVSTNVSGASVKVASGSEIKAEGTARVQHQVQLSQQESLPLVHTKSQYLKKDTKIKLSL